MDALDPRMLLVGITTEQYPEVIPAETGVIFCHSPTQAVNSRTKDAKLASGIHDARSHLGFPFDAHAKHSQLPVCQHLKTLFCNR